MKLNLIQSVIENFNNLENYGQIKQGNITVSMFEDAFMGTRKISVTDDKYGVTLLYQKFGVNQQEFLISLRANKRKSHVFYNCSYSSVTKEIKSEGKISLLNAIKHANICQAKRWDGKPFLVLHTLSEENDVCREIKRAQISQNSR